MHPDASVYTGYVVCGKPLKYGFTMIQVALLASATSGVVSLSWHSRACWGSFVEPRLCKGWCVFGFDKKGSLLFLQ